MGCQRVSRGRIKPPARRKTSFKSLRKKQKKDLKMLKVTVFSCIIVLLIGVFLGLTLFGSLVGQVDGRAATHNTVRGVSDEVIFANGTVAYESLGNDLTFTPLNVALDETVQEFTYHVARSYNLDFAFVMAVMYQESRFDPGAESHTDDIGLMQINRVNRAWLANKFDLTDFEDPFQNIKAGVFMLYDLFNRYEDPSKVLMAYNIGENGAALLWNRGITNTRYSRSVLSIADRFRRELG